MGNKGGMKDSTSLLFTTGALLVVIASLSFPLLADADSKPSHHGVYVSTPPPPKKPTYVPKPPPHKPYYMPPKSPKKPPVKHMPPPPYAPEDMPSTVDTLPAPVVYKVFKSPPIVVTIPGHPKSPPKGKSPPPPKMKKLFPPPPPKKKFRPPLY